jgi:hypothetical protein
MYNTTSETIIIIIIIISGMYGNQDQKEYCMNGVWRRLCFLSKHDCGGDFCHILHSTFNDLLLCRS